MLKFLMLTTFYPPYNFGGDGIFIYRLCNELARHGHSVDVVHCANAYELLEPGGPKGEYPNHPNITVHTLRSRFGFLSPLLTQQTGHPFFKAAAIKKLISEKRFDVIHYHNMSLIGLRALAYGEAIKLYTMHEHWLVCPMHVLWKYNREVCQRRACIRCQIFGKRPVQWWRYSGLMERALSHVDAFISPSRFTMRKHQELGLDLPIAHIPYFLPKSVALSGDGAAEGGAHGRPYFLFVGRLEKIKGVQNLLRVFRRYTACDLLVAGDGAYGAELRRLGADLPHVKFLGRVAYVRLRSLYRNALAVIVPSICYEVFGIIILESFAMRTPVIVNNLGALPEVVEESGGGFVYNNDDELIAHMERLRQDPPLRNELGERGHRAYLNRWTEDACLEKYYRLIGEIAARKSIRLPVESIAAQLRVPCCEQPAE